MRDSFVSITVADGQIRIADVRANKGDTVFMSAGERAEITGNGSYILTCVEKQ